MNMLPRNGPRYPRPIPGRRARVTGVQILVLRAIMWGLGTPNLSAKLRASAFTLTWLIRHSVVNGRSENTPKKSEEYGNECTNRYAFQFALDAGPSRVHRISGDEASRRDLRITKEVDPKFGVSGILERLERDGRFPMVIFENVKGSKFPLVANMHASFERLRLALGMEQGGVKGVRQGMRRAAG